MTEKKFDIRAEITNSIVNAMLTKNVVPWRMTWTQGGFDMPRNGSSKKSYRGVNVIHLWVTAMIKNYSSQEWFTYKQAAELGGQVRPGEKATQVIFWKFLEDKKDPKRKIPLARYYNVFNRDQIDGLPEVKVAVRSEHEAIDAAEAIIAGMPNPPTIRRNQPSDRAYYRPSNDSVVLPMLSQFGKPAEFYSTAFHELGHATGHKSRLDRKLEDSYLDKHAYSKEELVAELTAAFLCAEAGIVNETIENSTAYIVGWVKKIKEEPSLIHDAASAAQKAADLIVNRKFTDKSKDDEGDTSSEGAAVVAKPEPVVVAPVAPAPVAKPKKVKKTEPVVAAPVAPAPVAAEPTATSEADEEAMHAEVMAIINNPNSSEADRARARAWLFAA